MTSPLTPTNSFVKKSAKDFFAEKQQKGGGGKEAKNYFC
jgi:hypothetical protein